MGRSRRDFLTTGMAAAAAAGVPRSSKAGTKDTFVDIIRPPDFAAAYVDGVGRISLSASANRWHSGDVEVEVEEKQQGKTLLISVASPRSPLERLHLRWWGRLPEGTRFLGDHWERSYGDLEWRGFAANRVMPWYFLAATEQGTHGYGVKTDAAAFCFWQVDEDGISLWLDVRNGGSGVQLVGRRLAAAEVVALHGLPDASPYGAACELCSALCERPRLPDKPVYGSNNWYYLYGKNMSAENVLQDVEQLAELSPVSANPPYMVIDEGWGKARDSAGPWTEDSLRFPEVPDLPAQMKKRGVRAGIWVRPLISVDPRAKEWKLARDEEARSADEPVIIDPSIPEALDYLREGLRRVTGWGYELVKHDYSTFDIMGRWGFRMGEELTSSGWHFADRTKTTAEIVMQLYRALREGVGEAVLLGCNTVGHLGAGIFELQRIGDDTSGPNWNRTRKMGVNTLSFRLPQHRRFFLADPDCAALSESVPLELSRQWLNLVARSGTALFISADPARVTAEEKGLLKEALSAASHIQPQAQAVDWMETMTPRRWQFGNGMAGFDWFGKEGVDFSPE